MSARPLTHGLPVTSETAAPRARRARGRLGPGLPLALLRHVDRRGTGARRGARGPAARRRAPELARVPAATVGAIADYDAEHGTAILETLVAYLDNDCNMNATATAIFAHRHTVAYRLERVHELTGLDPLRREGRERLGLGLKTAALLAA
jgi:PucR-like helix-turn-helix protein